MKQLNGSSRYLATDSLRDRIASSGRRADWLAQKAGISKSLLSRVMARQRTIAEVEARILAALLDEDFGVLFEVPSSADLARDGYREAAVA